MTMKRRLALCLVAGGVFASPGLAKADPSLRAQMLAVHAHERAALGLPPLRWSDALAAKAQSWADHLAGIGQLIHSGPGQNLAMASAGWYSPAQLAELWVGERANFTDGVFPETSSTGNWADTGHYSQMIWRDTTELGCGFAAGGQFDVLVCDYDPPGNVMGEQAY